MACRIAQEQDRLHLAKARRESIGSGHVEVG
jgi:hypothetical protein